MSSAMSRIRSFSSFLIGRMQNFFSSLSERHSTPFISTVVGHIKNLVSKITERQDTNPALANAALGLGLAVVTVVFSTIGEYENLCTTRKTTAFGGIFLALRDWEVTKIG